MGKEESYNPNAEEGKVEKEGLRRGVTSNKTDCGRTCNTYSEMISYLSVVLL